MSSEDVQPKRHRHTRSAATISSATASSQNPRNPHHMNAQAYTQNSESDMNYPAQPRTPPRTPRRDNQIQNGAHPGTQENGSKQKSRNKNRPKNVMTSPVVKGNDRITPPLTGAQSAKPINTPSTAVYAGATFHASPAPSALPIPSFYSKSVPDSPGIKGLKSLKDASLSKNTLSPTPPIPSASANQFQREESPLDIFFRADREEKERARSASSANTAGTPTGPFHPPPGSVRNAQTPPAPGSQNQHQHSHTSKSSMGGMFAMELDGPYSLGAPFGPAFSTPYSERIKAAKSAKINGRQDQALDRSEALKAYLFSGLSPPANSISGPAGSVSPPTTTTTLGGTRTPTTSQPPHNRHPYTHDGVISNNIPRTNGRSSGLRQEVTPTKTPTKTPDHNAHYTNSPTSSRMYENSSPSNRNQFTGRFASPTASPSPASPYSISSGTRSSDLQGMEDSLRKILKLDSARSSGVTQSGIESTSTAPVSGYVGGRIPPMSGMNNGVMRS